jgi:PAP_fibrillin
MKSSLVVIVVVQCFVVGCRAFQPLNPSALLFGSKTPTRWHRTLKATSLPAEAVELKSILVQRITEFRQLKDRDGDLSIDFGVKGGELNQTSRAPQKVDFYSISKDVGDKAQEIIEICEQLANYCPIEIATEFLGDTLQGDQAPLNGPWKSLFTTAADANFSKNSKRGAAKVQNIVNGKKSTITNVIDFVTKEDGTEPVLKQLNVVIKALPVSAKRVELEFKYAKAVFTKFFVWKLRWALYIPVPGPFITRCIVFLSRILRFGKVKKVPKGYFDLLYLDDDLRVHRTGEDNIFVQSRDTWEAAMPLLN